MFDENTRSLTYERTSGLALSGLGAALGSRMFSYGNRAGIAGVLGGAFVGAALGDSTHTKLPIGSIILGSTLTATAAAGIALTARPIVSKGVTTLISSIKDGFLSEIKSNEALDYIVKLKASNKLANRYLSKAGIVGVVMGFSVPFVHSNIQRSIAEKSMRLDSKISSTINTQTDSSTTTRRHSEKDVVTLDRQKSSLNITETIKDVFK